MMVQELKSTKYFDIRVDNTKDNLKKEPLVILLRYFNEGKVKE